MPRNQTEDWLAAFNFEAWLDYEGIDYKPTYGSSGPQLNLKSCPFCGDERWIVYVGADSGLGNCNTGACGTRFNAFTFVRAYFDYTNKQTIDHMRKFIAENAHYEIKRVPVIEQTALVLPDCVAACSNSDALEYLKIRGINMKTCVEFDLKYVEKAYHEYDTPDGEAKQLWRDRILFPICDLQGDLVSFQGRSLGKNKQKYIFPPGRPATGRYIYNAQNVLGEKDVVMGEGVFDALAIHQTGWPAVASFGKDITAAALGDAPDQLTQLFKLKHAGMARLHIVWDGTKDALRAAVDKAILLNNMGIKTHVAKLPKDKDPNEVSERTLSQAINDSLPVNKINAVQLIL